MFAATRSEYDQLDFALAFFCWNETARSIVHRIDEVQRSSAYTSALTIGCSIRRICAVYFLPVLKKEFALGFFKIFLTVLFIESALSYCGAGIDRYTTYRTVASFIKENINSVLPIPPYGPVLLRYLPSMILGGALVVAIGLVGFFTKRYSEGKSFS